MKKLIETIRNLFKKENRMILLVVLAFGVIVIAILVQLISNAGGGNEPDVIDQPLNFDNDVRVLIDEDVEIDVDRNLARINVYEIANIDHSDLIQSFLNRVGKGFWRGTNQDDIYYVWSKDGTPQDYFADYDTSKDTLYFKFEDPIELTEVQSVTELVVTDPVSLLEEVFFRYFDMNVSFEKPESVTNRNEIRFEARRTIDGLPLISSSNVDFSDYLVFDTAGRLKEGSILLAEFEAPEKASLFEVEYLGSAINQSAYPKSVSAGFPIGLNLSDLGIEPYEDHEDFDGDAPAYDFDPSTLIPNKCEVRSIELVYYFFRTNTEKLSPVYKLGCRGEIEFSGSTYQVPITIFANALDPEVVYVPGTFIQD